MIASSSGTGYAANGNVLNATDSVTGTWAYGYDSLNRLTSATGSAGTFNGTIGVSGVSIDWQYDWFGNRTFQTASTVNLPSEWAQYSAASNRLVSTNLAIGSMQYDAAGDVLFDGINSYAYDAEGRVCAVGNGSAYTGYVYDAEGNRVAKGSVNGLNCNLSTNGFSLTRSYIRGSGGELLTEMGAGGQWVYSDAYADGQLRATYNADGNTYFALNDWLGTKRAELSAAGCLETFGSLPFGDDLTPLGNCPDATEQHFTGKERDTESGLDYFGARYYASSMGRFMSPDWDSKPQAVPYANLADPQSLNLYSYVLNNPLSKADPNGHDWFDVDGKWQWQKGHVYHDADGNATKAKGYAGLLVAEKTGTNKEGAATYKLTLYDQNKVVATGTGFSGNSNYADTPPIKDGNYQILGRFDPPPTAPNPASPDNNPPTVYGYQKIDPTLGAYANAVYQAYGPMRARLNPLDPGGTAGAYFHGQFGDAFHSEGWTHGCLSYGRDTTMINYMSSHFGSSWTGVSVDTPVTKPQ